MENKINAARLAQDVMDMWIHEGWRDFTELGLSKGQSKAVKRVLEGGQEYDGIVTEKESSYLAATGLPGGFIKALAGPDGKRPMHEKIKYLNTCITDIDIAGNTAHQEMCIRALEHYGDYAKPAIPALIKSLSSDVVQLRLAALWVLAQLPSSEAVLPIAENLNHPYWAVRLSAAWALGTNAFVGASEAVPALSGIVEPYCTDELDVCEIAEQALRMIREERSYEYEY